MAQTALGLLGANPEDSLEAGRGIIRGAISRIMSRRLRDDSRIVARIVLETDLDDSPATFFHHQLYYTGCAIVLLMMVRRKRTQYFP